MRLTGSNWMRLTGDSGICAAGARHMYLVTLDVTAAGELTAARLTRWVVQERPAPLFLAGEAVRNVIIFPLGRGPGRPAMEPEFAALIAVAKAYAEKFEAGESLEGYPAWQQPPAKPRTSIYRDEPSAVRRYLDEGLAGGAV
jgi:hypothetical protein